MDDANDLADEILYRYADEGGNYANGFFKAIEITLRQQQAELNSLTEWKNTWLPYLRKHLGVTDL